MQYNLFLVFIFGSGILGGLITQDLWGGFLFAMVALGISGAILSFRSYYLIKSKGKTIDAYVTGTARFGYARFRPTVRFEVDGVEYESVIQLGILTHKKFYDHGTKLQIDLVLLEPIQKKTGYLSANTFWRCALGITSAGKFRFWDLSTWLLPLNSSGS